MKLSIKLIFLASMLYASVYTIPPVWAQDSDPVEQQTDGNGASTTSAASEQSYEEWAQNFLEGLKMHTGTITLDDGRAKLELGDQFYFLSAADSKKVLEEAWGNPPGDGGLGMIFPVQYTPLSQAAWGVTVHFEELGYVNDGDAADINYDELLHEMVTDTDLESEERVEQGYDAIKLIGWASPPYYDAETKKLHWAKEIKFGTSEVNTLNYNVRILGRKGVLVLNFIASMDQLDEINAQIPKVFEMTNFENGNRYQDFDPSIDTVAAVGIGGLIAGKVLAKTGFLAVALIFLKKFWFVAVAAFIGLRKKIFGEKGDTETKV